MANKFFLCLLGGTNFVKLLRNWHPYMMLTVASWYIIIIAVMGTLQWTYLYFILTKEHMKGTYLPITQVSQKKHPQLASLHNVDSNQLIHNNNYSNCDFCNNRNEPTKYFILPTEAHIKAKHLPITQVSQKTILWLNIVVSLWNVPEILLGVNISWSFHLIHFSFYLWNWHSTLHRR